MRTAWQAAWASFTGALLVLVFGCASPRVGDGEKSLPSTVVRLKGSARYAYNGDKEWTPIRVGEILKPGARIQTAAGSFVDLVLGVGVKVPRGLMNPDPRIYGQPCGGENTVRLTPDSVLFLTQVAQRTSAIWAGGPDHIALRLEAGGFYGSVHKSWRELSYTVSIAAGTVRLEDGAQFSLECPGRLIMRNGAATATLTEQDAVRRVKAGDTLDFSTGKVMVIPYLP